MQFSFFCEVTGNKDKKAVLGQEMYKHIHWDNNDSQTWRQHSFIKPTRKKKHMLDAIVTCSYEPKCTIIEFYSSLDLSTFCHVLVNKCKYEIEKELQMIFIII